MNVAILDDGVNKKEIRTRVIRKAFVNDSKCLNTSFSHGTICAKIIEKYGKVDTFFDLKILNESCKGDIETLISALEYCKRLKVSLINLSIGIENYLESSIEYWKLYKVCNDLSKKGVMIFSAQSNSGVKTIPADFACVYSVEDFFNFFCKPSMIYRRSDYYAISKHYLQFKQKAIISERCNSFACAYATALSSKNTDIFDFGVILNSSISSSSVFFYIENFNRNADKRSIYKEIFLQRKGLLHSFWGSVSTLLPKNKIEIPILYISCTDSWKRAMQLAKELKFLLKKDGYRANILSFTPSAIKYDIDYIPNANLLRAYTISSHSEIIIVLYSNKVFTEPDDLEVLVSHDEFICKFDKKTIYKTNVKNTYELYKFIVKCYS